MARPARKPAAKPETPPRPKLTLADYASLTSDIRTLTINLAILVIFVILVPVIAKQFLRDQVLIEPIAVPEGLAATGLTPEVAANRLWDGLKQIEDEADSAKRSVTAVPDSQRIDFSIPDSGISIDSLVHYVRQFFNAYETRISGEFRCGDADCTPEAMTLRIRVLRDTLEVLQLEPAGLRTEAEYFREAASRVLGVLDPYTALAAEGQRDPLRATVLARQLIRAEHPDAKWAHNFIGNVLSNRDDLPGALDEYRAALKLDPNFAQALINQGGALLDSGDVAGARQSLEAAKRIAPDDVFLLAAYADLAFAENQPDEAVRLLAEASRRAPKNPTFLTKAGNIEFGRGRTAEAEALWRQALQVNPADTLPMLMLAQSYEIAGRGSELEPFFRDAADYAPDDAEMQAQHAEYARRAQNLATALRRADRAVALAPAVSAYRVTRAWVLRDMLRFDEALADFDVAIGLEPGKAGLLYDRARTLQLADRRAEAVAAYRLFVEKAPEDMYAPLARQVIAELSKPPEAVPATP